MNREQYRAYLKTDHWLNLRSKAIKRFGKLCAICKKPGTVDVHHITYRNIYDVTVSDLRPLCRSCHDSVHDIQRENRRSKKKLDPKKAFNKISRQIRNVLGKNPKSFGQFKEASCGISESPEAYFYPSTSKHKDGFVFTKFGIVCAFSHAGGAEFDFCFSGRHYRRVFALELGEEQIKKAALDFAEEVFREELS